MAGYTAPLADMRFVLDEIVGLDELARLPGLESASPDTVTAVLNEAAKFAGQVLAPLNRVGDLQRSVLADDRVRTPDGFKDAYRQFVAGGWNGIMCDPAYGGQGLPWAVALAVLEMWESANLAFSLCPVLTQAAIEALTQIGTPEQRRLYLAKLVSGEWTGTMNLTEPQAGSDVGALKARAVKEGDHYRITGTKIFITYGEHDYTDNIIHLVLARTPGAAPGTKGISLFIVPKFLVNPDGSLGARNDLRAVSLEHKLGIHASPTAVMSYGDKNGAIGYLVGAEGEGMRAMFLMMNNARLTVGLEGLGIAERAYQQALAYAKERKQGRAIGASGADSSPIVLHPDVRRMLMTMKATNEAMRALAYTVAAGLDRAKREPDPAARAAAQAFVDLMIPVLKGWCTDMGVEMTSLGVQIHGGMGYIEETGAAQHFRDARIAPIYEGTNGIQALDLVMRKLPREDGAAVKREIAAMRGLDRELGAVNDPAFAAIRGPLVQATQALGAATEWMLAHLAADPTAAAAGASAYLRLFGTAYGGFMLAKSALKARALASRNGHDAAFAAAKIATARFYAEQILAPAPGLLAPITAGAEALFAIDPELMSA
jgi:alkylation response protein AidB-like acyl-CoA dehydrogenase